MAKRSAFSLIELLVVIALIGILVAIATVSYSTMQKRARDSRRISDMKAIQNSFEQYYADNNSTYPPAGCVVGITYLPNDFPKDPQTNLAYSQSCSTAGYCVCAALEATAGNSTTDCSTTIGTWYCIHNTQ